MWKSGGVLPECRGCPLLNDLIRLEEQRLRDRQPKGFGGLE